MKTKAIILILTAIIHVGCLGPKIVRMDGDTYLIQKRSAQIGFGPPEGAKADVYKVANEFCASKGMVVETVDFKMVNSNFGRPGSVALQFRCVLPQQSEKASKSDTSDAEKKLAELKRLFERGLITKEEYDQKKETILNSL